MSVMDAAFEEHVRASASLRAAAIERAIEQALQGGEHGVLVNEDEGWARPHVSVPYGQLHVLPREEMDECNHADGRGHLCDLPPGHPGPHSGPHGSQRAYWNEEGDPTDPT